MPRGVKVVDKIPSEELGDLLLLGYTSKECADHFGVSLHYVYHIVVFSSFQLLCVLVRDCYDCVMCTTRCSSLGACYKSSFAFLL